MNYKRLGSSVSHVLRCVHSSLSLSGLHWTLCTDAPICAIAGNGTRIVAICEDALTHIVNLKGRYSMPPFLISSLPSKIALHGVFLMVATIKATLHVWNIFSNKTVVKSESLLPLLNQPGGPPDQGK